MEKKFIVSVIAVSLFAFSGLALAMNDVSTKAYEAPTSDYSSYSEEQLVTLIAKLQKQLEIVRENKVQCALPEVDLSIGDGEDSVSKEYTKSLQAFLKEKGYFYLEPTGYYGKITRASLVNFQKENGLTQSGVFDAPIRNYIKTLKCKNTFVSAVKSTTQKDAAGNDLTSLTSKAVTSIQLKGDGKVLRWAVRGYSENGFKIVWSKTKNPTYPNRNGDKYIFLTDPNATVTTIYPFEGNGTYYARICEYLGGSCGTYSNEISISL